MTRPTNFLPKLPYLEGITWRLILVLVAVALGTNFQLYSNSVINNLINIAQPWVNQSFTDHYDSILTKDQFYWLWSLSTASLHFGALFGSLATSALAESQYFGRRRSLMLVSMVTIFGGILNGCAKNANSFEVFATGRFVLGLALGAGTGLGSIFVSELAPRKYRGACGSVQQLSLGFGNFLSQLLTLPEILGSENLWPLAVAFPLFPGFIQLVTLAFSPESPRFLYLTRGEQAMSQKAIEFYQGPERVRAMFTDFRKELQSSGNERKIGITCLFRQKTTLVPLLLSLMINFGVQMSGIGAIMAYSESMFKEAGLSSGNAKYATVGLGVCNFLSSFLTMFVVEKKGRKPLLLAGYALCFVCLVLLSILNQGHSNWQWSQWTIYSTIPCLYIYQIGFALSSSISWIVPAELFAQNARSSAMTVVIFSRWFMQCITVLLYLPFRDLVGVSWSYVPFICCIVVAGTVLAVLLPETKGKSFRDISAFFGYEHLIDEAYEEDFQESPDVEEDQKNYGSLTDAAE